MQLSAQLTEVGTLEVDCIAADDPARRWRLAFQLRGGDTAALARLHPRFPEATARIERFYGSRAADVEYKEIKTLRTDLERLFLQARDLETPLLRELFEVLWTGARRRRRSADHERLWFSLTGYCLRPGSAIRWTSGGSGGCGRCEQGAAPSGCPGAGGSGGRCGGGWPAVWMRRRNCG